jgi:hypothetical protein
MRRHAIQIQQLERTQTEGDTHDCRRSLHRHTAEVIEHGIETVAPLDRTGDQLKGEAAVTRCQGAQFRQAAIRQVDMVIATAQAYEHRMRGAPGRAHRSVAGSGCCHGEARPRPAPRR